MRIAPLIQHDLFTDFPDSAGSMPAIRAVTAESLFNAHHRLAGMLAKRYFASGKVVGLDTEDIEQEALLGLWVAAQRWAEGMTGEFGRYANSIITHHCIQALGRGRRIRKHGRWVESPGAVDLASVRDEPGQMETKEQTDRLHDSLAELDERERRVLRLRFGLDGHEPLTLMEIASRGASCSGGATAEHVRNVEDRALAKLHCGVRRRLQPIPKRGSK